MIEAASLLEGTPRKGRFSFGSLLRLAGGFLFALGWLLPNHYLPWVYFHSEAAAMAALLAWSAACLVEHRRADPVPWIALAPLALCAVVWAQWAFGLVYFSGEAWLATLYLGGLACAIAVGFQWQRSQDAPRPILEAVVIPLVAAAFVSSLLSLVQWFGVDTELGVFVANLGNFGRPFANLAQPNLLATLLVMGLVGLAWMVAAGMMARSFALAAGAFMAVAIVLTQSRAGFASAAAVAAWWALQRRRSGEPLPWRAIALSLGAAVALGAVLWGAHTLLGLGGAPPQKSFTGSSGRWVMWAQMLDGVRQSPLFGYGWHSSYAAQMAGSWRFPGELNTRFAHDVFIDMLCWFGVPLGLLLCVAVAVWWLARMRAAGDATTTLALAISLPVLVHSVFEFPFAFLFFLAPLGVMAGALEARRPQPRVLAVPTAAWAALTLALGVLGAFIAAEYFPAEADFRIVRFESLRVGRPPPEAQQPRFVLLTQIDALLTAGRAKPQPGRVTPHDVEQAGQIARKYPWAPLALQYAVHLEAAGRHAEAERQMQMIANVYGPFALVAAREEFDIAVRQWPNKRP